MESIALGRRIRALRMAAGLSLRELAERVPVSAQALSQYEHGRTQPRGEVLEALADALDTQVEQLRRDASLEWSGNVRIWHLTKGSRAAHGMIEASLAEMTEREMALEQSLGGGFPSPSLPRMEEIWLIRNPWDAEDLAQDVRRRWGLGTGPLPKLVSLFEARGIRVYEHSADGGSSELQACSAFVAASSNSRTELPVLLVNAALPGEQKRFALCHELAHMILASPLHHLWSSAAREKLANWFAGALLLPASALREQLGRRRRTVSWYELEEINLQFGISYYRIAHRARETGIISRDTFRDLLEEHGQRGWTEAPHQEGSALLPSAESSTRLKRLAIRAVTEGVMMPQEAAVLLDMKLGDLTALVEVGDAMTRAQSAFVSIPALHGG